MAAEIVKKNCGILICKILRQTMPINAPETINIALKTLLAAITRARLLLGVRD